MKINGMTDNRYKVTEQDILDMRDFKSLGFKRREIAEHYKISVSTVDYWTNSNNRESMKKKNAKRKHNPNDQKRIQRDLQKRKENKKETPRTFLREKLTDRINDKRSNVHTMYAMPIDKVKELKEKELLYRGNSKVSL